MKVILNRVDGTEKITRKVKIFQNGRYANPYRVLNYTLVKLNDNGTTDNLIYTSWTAAPSIKEKWRDFVKNFKHSFKSIFQKKISIFLVERGSWHRVAYRVYKQNDCYYVNASFDVGILNYPPRKVRLLSNGTTDHPEWNRWEKKSGWIGNEFDGEIGEIGTETIIEPEISSTPSPLNISYHILDMSTVPYSNSSTLNSSTQSTGVLGSSTNQHFPIKALSHTATT